MKWEPRVDGYQCETRVGTFYVRCRGNDWFAEYFSHTEEECWVIIEYGTEEMCKKLARQKYREILLNLLKEDVNEDILTRTNQL